jgi:protein TonB
VITSAIMALVVAVGSWSAIRAFPLVQGAAAQESGSGPGPLERSAKPITPENPIPRRSYSVMPVYPPEAGAIGLTVAVPVRATLDEYGRVAEARVLNMGVPASGVESDPAGRRALDAVRRSAIDAVRSWQYDAPADGPLSFTVVLLFGPGAATASEARAADPSQAAAVGGMIGRGGRGRAGGPPPPPPPPPPPWAADAVRVGGAIRQPAKVTHVSPVYPQDARDANVQGIVIIEAVIAPDGRVGEARVIRSIPLLDQAAIDAVMQWEFTPTLLNGVPVPVIMTVTVNFTLT